MTTKYKGWSPGLEIGSDDGGSGFDTENVRRVLAGMFQDVASQR